MNARLRMYKYCYSNEDAIYAKGLLSEFSQLVRFFKEQFSDHSFTHVAVARWQDSMSRGQKS